MSDRPPKPIPAVTPELAPFFAAAREHRLVVQRCTACGALRFPARAVCSQCLSQDAEWMPVSGKGRVFSVVIMHQAIDPGFAAEVPYAVVMVELDEGVRMMSNVVDVAPHDIEVGQPLEVVFERLSDEVTLPKFRLVS